MLLGPFVPDVSCTLGPGGSAGVAGGAPCAGGTSFTSKVFWSGIHRSSSPSMGLSRTPPSRRTAALPASPAHSSTPSAPKISKT